MVSVSPRRSCRTSSSPDKQGRAGAFNAHALSGIADIFQGHQKHHVLLRRAAHPDVMVADVPHMPAYRFISPGNGCIKTVIPDINNFHL